MAVAYYQSKIGLIRVVSEKTSVRLVEFLRKKEQASSNKQIPHELAGCVKQLEDYFKGVRKKFSWRLCPQGTEFQKKVWRELRKIPYGQTVCYEEIARRVGNPKALRAAGTAMGKNPIAVVVPCHRVINKSGRIGHYASGHFRKKWLLNHEKRDQAND